MRGHLAFLSMFNAVCHVGHQGLSRYCTTGSSLEPVTMRHRTVENVDEGCIALLCFLDSFQQNCFKVVFARRPNAISQGKSTKRSRLEIHQKVRPLQ